MKQQQRLPTAVRDKPDAQPRSLELERRLLDADPGCFAQLALRVPNSLLERENQLLLDPEVVKHSLILAAPRGEQPPRYASSSRGTATCRSWNTRLATDIAFRTRGNPVYGMQ